MAHHTAIHKQCILLTFLLIVGNALLAQERIEPFFKYENPATHRRINIGEFLSKLPIIHFKEECLFASGTFRFKVTNLGKIDTMEIKGNLPDTVVRVIKTRIRETEKYWVTLKEESRGDSRKWFVLPVFIDRRMNRGCKDDQRVGESKDLLLQLFNQQGATIVTGTSYLILPICFWGSY